LSDIFQVDLAKVVVVDLQEPPALPVVLELQVLPEQLDNLVALDLVDKADKEVQFPSSLIFSIKI
jgi:hypothetical protein